MRNYSYKRGFTLAEVLITLGIIGIVAALTIPTLVANYKKSRVETDLKYSYSFLQNLVKLSSIDNGNPQTWGIGNEDSDVFDNYFIDYLKGAKRCSTAEIYHDNSVMTGRCQTNFYSMEGELLTGASRKYILANGIGVMYKIGGTLQTSQRRGTFFVDLGYGDGLVAGKNLFPFNLIIVNDGYFVTSTQDYPQNKNFCNESMLNHNSKIDYCKTGQSAAKEGYIQGITCTALIECNGWKVPNDYPAKF